MPARAKTTTPKPKSWAKTPGSKKNKATIVKEHVEIDDLSKDFSKKLAMQNYANKSKHNGYETGVLVWKEPATQQTYLDIRVEMPLRIKKKNLDPPPSLSKDCKKVTIWVKKPINQLNLILVFSQVLF